MWFLCLVGTYLHHNLNPSFTISAIKTHTENNTKWKYCKILLDEMRIEREREREIESKYNNLLCELGL